MKIIYIWWSKFNSLLKYLYLFIGIVILSACHSNENLKIKYKTIVNSDLPPEIKLPSAIWDLLEDKKVIDSKGKIIQNNDFSTKLKENVFVGLTVWLREKTPGILGGENIEIKAIKSGMNLDLSRYIKLEKGTFYINFKPNAIIDPITVKVIFLSQGVSRKKNEQNLGGGCGKFYDITKFYLKNLAEKSIEVNVTDGRHISFLAGTFFIRVSDEKGVRDLTQLTITDPSHPELICDGISEIEEKE